MTGLLTTRAALLQLLRKGPAGYGSDLIRQFAEASAGRIRLSLARVYPTLRDLEAEGLVRAVRLAPKGRRGARVRIYYDLTPKGLEAATVEREILLAVLAPRSVPPTSEKDRQRMAERVLEAEELSELGAALEAADR